MNAPTVFGAPVRWPAKINEIPKDIFDREDIFRMELERIFYGPEWHPVAHTGEIPNPGDFKTFHIGERPLLVVHGLDGQVRVFYNACSHRGTLLETNNRGNKTEFECPYHRWLFDSTGALRGCPGKDDFSPSFRQEETGLEELRTAIVGGLIMTTLHPDTPDIDTWLGRTKPALLQLLGGDGRLRLLGYQKVSYDCNWKAYVDNDGYHAPLLHLAFKMLNWQGGGGTQFATENGHLAFQSELKVPNNPDFLRDPSLIEFKGTQSSKGSIIVSLNPLTVMTKHLDMINVRFAVARSLLKTEVHYAYFAHVDDDEEMVRHRLRQSSNMLGPCGMVSMEDASIFLRVQHGNRTPGNAVFQKGVKQEHGMWLDFKQNDEAGNLPKWEYYRRVMGFEREEN
ncbi:MAG TPA: (2Fe-2S)-binding protein [Gammaproteobacteria bacterium]|uniref:aromatic ring-hydroxylating oxygenase subunit alpha n=1 Tax=Immundisolibacter sp. TaxID=1934948 RepID=UPI000E887C38|nr:(2Fe-2S)-binding protein [Gammaproteobacteria bacterium]HCZ47971.1 (2Fe-2S)-binding protein [Gammaproteobacteria bacterium]MCH77409.1 (2Fe-2S)-binding protein [Gammaproteobacteria bacterium]